jgi:hypothetical protein
LYVRDAPLIASAVPARSFWQRLNALFFYTLSVLGFLAFMAAVPTHFHQAEPKIELRLERILLCAPHPDPALPCSARSRRP